jgi:ABC-type sugar transport system ATPase subunit
MHILEVKALRKKQGEQWVANGISFTQQPLEKLAIAGETGSGKSTLLKLVAGLAQLDEGEILFEQEPVLGPMEKLLPGYPAIGYLSQHFELRNNYRVEEILDMALQLDSATAQTIFDVCRISHLLKRRTNELSGGEKQRIATARLLISAPRLLLLDEPYSNLDMVHKNILRQVIHDIGDKLQITCILVSHDPVDLLQWADRIMVLRNGQIVQTATPHNIYHKPGDAYTAGLFGRYNTISLSLYEAFNALDEQPFALPTPYLRPEHFKLTTDPSIGLAATVLISRFLGHSYETEVCIERENLLLHTPKLHKVNEVVYVKLVGLIQ